MPKRLTPQTLDKQYREWLSYQPSALSGQFSEWMETGEGRCIACHIRRSADAGTGYKPLFSAIPLTHLEHVQQHMYGESIHMPLEWYEKTAVEYLNRWLHDQPPEAREIVAEVKKLPA